MIEETYNEKKITRLSAVVHTISPFLLSTSIEVMAHEDLREESSVGKMTPSSARTVCRSWYVMQEEVRGEGGEVEETYEPNNKGGMDNQ
jgi:hypothetical protein